MPFFDISTRAARSALAPRGKAYWHRIVPNHHLGIRFLRGRGVSWVSRVRLEDGRYMERTLGRGTIYGVNDKFGGYLEFDEALKKAQLFREQLTDFGTPISSVAVRYNGEMIICPIGNIYTVGHALYDFIQWRRMSAARSTFIANVTQINYHLVPQISRIPLAEFNADHFEQLCRHVLQTTPRHGSREQVTKVKISDLDDEQLRKRKKTINGLVSILRAAFVLARDRGEIETDRPIRCLRRLPNYDCPRPSYLTRPQAEILLEASPKPIRDLIAAALYTGCRVGELTELKVKHVADQCFGIYVARSKNHRTRFVFLPTEGMLFFLNLCLGKDMEDLVFLHADGQNWRKRYRTAFKKAVLSAGLPKDTNFHSLRHSYASQLVEDGTPLSIVARQLGHANTMTVDRVYGHLSPSWSEFTIEKHFAPLQRKLNVPAEVHEQVDQLRKNPTGLGRQGEDRREGWPLSKSDTMPTDSEDLSWPTSNRTLFQGAVLRHIAPKRRNAP